MDYRAAAHVQSRLGLRVDWMRRLGRLLSSFQGDNRDWSSGEALARRIAEFECAVGRAPTGIVTASTRLALLERFDSLRVQWIGPELAPHEILSWQTESALYDFFRDNVERLDGVWMERDCGVQLVGLRGVRMEGRSLRRTESARRFSESPYGSRPHLSSAKSDYFDSVMGVFWREAGVKHGRLFRCVVNPASIWPEGTAHLNNGQYAFCLGRHRTRDGAHMDAVRRYVNTTWEKSWIFDDAGDSVQYLALVGISPIEVVRSSASSLDVSEDDIARAERAFAERLPEFVDEHKIRINIHSCAENEPSSLGCQNIAPEDYAEFMSIIVRLAERQKKRYGLELPIEYYLTDGSWFNAQGEVTGEVER